MDENTVKQMLKKHYGSVMGRVRDAIEACPDEEWKTGDTPYQRPAGLAAHLVETIHFYTSGLSGAEFPWGQRLGVDWEVEDDTLLPDKTDVLAYLDEMNAHMEAWIAETDFFAPEELHPYSGDIIMERAIYLLRHCQHHLAELNYELLRRGFQAPEWM